MTSPPEPSPSGDTAAALAVQVAALRGQVAALKTRLDHDVTGKQMVVLAEIKRLRSQVTELAQTVTESRDGSRQHAPAAPYWIDLSPQDHASQLAELRQWADTVLRREYGGNQLPACWANHPHTIWELSTLAAEWHRTYDSDRPSLDRALEFHDRWLPGTMRRLADITCRCPRMRRPATPPEHRTPVHAARLAANARMEKGPAIMTTVKLTPSELRLLDIQKARGIPFPEDIFAWREANAAAIAELETETEL